MNREQIEAWLVLEGWSPVIALHENAVKLKWHSIMRGVDRIESDGRVWRNTTWAGTHKKIVTTIDWDVFLDDELKRVYEKARLL